MRWLASLLAVLVALNAWDPFGMGDPFRDGRVRIMLYIGAPILGMIMSRWIPWLLVMAWVWMAWLMAYWGPDAYGWPSLVLPPVFLLVAGWLQCWSPSAVMSGIRITYLVQCSIGIIQALGYLRDLFPSPEPSAIGTMGHFTLLGCFIAPLVPVALFYWSSAEAILGLVLVACTGSTMSAAALGGALVIMFWRRVGIRLALATAGLGLSVVALAWIEKPDASWLGMSGRMQVWKTVWRFSLEHPMGWGPGSWVGLYPHWSIASWSKMQWLDVHNDWLHLKFEGGWPCLVLAVIFTVGVVKTTNNPIKATIIGGLAVAAAGNFVLHFPATAFLACLAIFLPERNEEIQ